MLRYLLLGCDWSYQYFGRCYLRAGDQGDMGPLGGSGEDQFFYPGVTCAQQKAKQSESAEKVKTIAWAYVLQF